MTLLDHAERSLGGSDCEAISDGLLAQPVAAVSSLAFVVAGGALLWHVRGLPRKQRWAAGTYAGLMVATGVGSVAYHGPQGPGAQVLHDLPIALLVAEAIAVPVARRWARVPIVRPDRRRYVAVAAAAGVAAGVAFVAGRTSSPVCDPESLFQLHGAWHLTAAGALGAWALALWPRAQP